MKICLDAGHGGHDSGACGNYSKEKDIVLKMVKKLGAVLQRQNVNVTYTRTTDEYVPLINRAFIANNAGVDLFVSIHCNSAAQIANGTETLCYAVCDVSKKVQEALIKATGLRDRGIKERKDLAVLNCTKMTAILVELAFINNPAEEKQLNDNEWLEMCAEAIVRGICDSYGVTYKKYEEDTEMVTTTVMNVAGKDKNVRRILKDNENYIRLRDLEEIINIGYNADTKKVTISGK